MSDNDLDAWLDSGATLLGIEVAPEWREAIRLHLGITRDLARSVMEFPLSDDADPAPVFRA